MSIERFDPEPDESGNDWALGQREPLMVAYPDAEFIRYSDHLRTLEELATWCDERAADWRRNDPSPNAYLAAASHIRSELLEETGE
jgi:hypothetical protein